jgi:hypothetical protein
MRPGNMVTQAWRTVWGACSRAHGADIELRGAKRTKRVLADSAPAVRNAATQGFAFAPADINHAITPPQSELSKPLDPNVGYQVLVPLPPTFAS